MVEDGEKRRNIKYKGQLNISFLTSETFKNLFSKRVSNPDLAYG